MIKQKTLTKVKGDVGFQSETKLLDQPSSPKKSENTQELDHFDRGTSIDAEPTETVPNFSQVHASEPSMEVEPTSRSTSPTNKILTPQPPQTLRILQGIHEDSDSSSHQSCNRAEAPGWDLPAMKENRNARRLPENQWIWQRQVSESAISETRSSGCLQERQNVECTPSMPVGQLPYTPAYASGVAKADQDEGVARSDTPNAAVSNPIMDALIPGREEEVHATSPRIEQQQENKSLEIEFGSEDEVAIKDRHHTQGDSSETTATIDQPKQIEHDAFQEAKGALTIATECITQSAGRCADELHSLLEIDHAPSIHFNVDNLGARLGNDHGRQRGHTHSCAGGLPQARRERSSTDIRLNVTTHCASEFPRIITTNDITFDCCAWCRSPVTKNARCIVACPTYSPNEKQKYCSLDHLRKDAAQHFVLCRMQVRIDGSEDDCNRCFFGSSQDLALIEDRHGYNNYSRARQVFAFTYYKASSGFLYGLFFLAPLDIDGNEEMTSPLGDVPSYITRESWETMSLTLERKRIPPLLPPYSLVNVLMLLVFFDRSHEELVRLAYHYVRLHIVLSFRFCARKDARKGACPYVSKELGKQFSREFGYSFNHLRDLQQGDQSWQKVWGSFLRRPGNVARCHENLVRCSDKGYLDNVELDFSKYFPPWLRDDLQSQLG